MKGRILIVEDELIVALDLKQILEQYGLEVVGTAPSAYAALQIAVETHPDLALMDINIAGGMSGIETARQLRESYGVPSVFLTAYCDDTTLAGVAAEMPYGYLIKPFSSRELEVALQIALHRRHEVAKARATMENFEATSMPMLQLDGNGHILRVNDALTRETGLAAGSLLGKTLKQLGESPDPRIAKVLAPRLQGEACLALTEAEWERHSFRSERSGLRRQRKTDLGKTKGHLAPEEASI
jgi:DNA-binding NarL/FixJ family response regulator